MQSNKRELGKYYTVNSPFKLEPFLKWFNSIPQEKKDKILEPFAGSCNIPLFFNGHIFDCFDIAPPENTKGYVVYTRDCIQDYPKNYHVAITNPPYLGKSSAIRRHIDYPYPKYTDLYLKCLEVMLDNTEYVAAIIPESFITSGYFTDRLDAVVSLTFKLFDDTDCPVCLALFKNESTDDFCYYVMNDFCGTYSMLASHKTPDTNDIGWTFNDPNGCIGIICIDNTSGPSIEFVPGDMIDKDNIKVSSRSITRVSVENYKLDTNSIIEYANNELNRFRNDTCDLFLTSFKGLRKDGKYRRRITFAQARCILNYAAHKIIGD